MCSDRVVPLVACLFLTGSVEAQALFVRGDVDADAAYNVRDAISLILALFSERFGLPCEDAADIDDNGQYDMEDVVGIIRNQFANGPDPKPPFPDCGSDTTPDAFGCESFPPCEALTRGRLVLLTEPELQVGFTERVPIQVLRLDTGGAPIPDTLVAFESQADTADTRLSTASALTDAQGMAETFIEAGVQQVDFDVRISVPGDDTVQPISVHVRIQSKDASDYIIRVNYDGPLTLYQVEVFLYDADRACDTLTESPSEPPSPDVAWTSLVILPDAEGRLPDRSLNVPREVELHYAVARGEPSDGAGGGLGYFAAFGCADDLPSPDPSGGAVIEIDMHNLPRHDRVR